MNRIEQPTVSDQGFEPFGGLVDQSLAPYLVQLEKMFIDFLSRWRNGIGSLMPAIDVVAELDRLSIKTYAEYIRQSPDLAEVHVYEMDGFNAQCAWLLDRRVISDAVDSFFGGDGRIQPRNFDRRYTSTELSIRRRLLSVLTLAFESAFSPVRPLRLRATRQERRVSYMRIARDEQLVLQASLIVRFNHGEARLECCVPFETIKEIAPPEHQNEEFLGVGADPSSPFKDQFRLSIEEVPLEAVAVLTELDLSLAQIAELSIGQILPIDIASKPVRLMIEDREILTARYGTRNGAYALQVERMSVDVAPNQENLTAIELPAVGETSTESTAQIG